MYDELKKLIDDSNNIVFFGGAGVSTESGIPDFRSVDGLYNQKYDYPPETILSHSFFMRKTEEFYKFYRDKMICTTAKPNYAHIALAKLEEMGKLKAVVTQNIDGLHQMAGSKIVYELKPDVVLYGEGLDDDTTKKAVRAIARADVLIIGGTSLNVYPAASFIKYFQGSQIVLINKSETPFDTDANVIIRDPIGQVLKEVVLN